MKIDFRQGIVSHSKNNLGQQTFLSIAGGGIQISAVNTPLIVNFAHRDENYLHYETADILAWPNPFTTGVRYYLYLDLDRKTAVRTFGKTERQPVFSPLVPPMMEPPVPSLPPGFSDFPVLQEGRHWFDITNFRHWVYEGGFWKEKIRCFVGSVLNSSFSSESINAPLFTGTQIGYVGNVVSGRIFYDQTLTAVKKLDGTFLTSESPLYMGGSKINGVRLESNIQLAKNSTGSPIAEYTIAAIKNDGTIRQANSADPGDTIVVMTLENILPNDFGNVIIQGVVSNVNWSYTSSGIPLWVNNSGLLTDIDPGIDTIPVARVFTSNSIVFEQGLGGKGVQGDPGPGVVVATDILSGKAKLSVASLTPLDPVVVETNDPRMTDARTPLSHSHIGGDISFTPYGDVSSLTLQNAIQELDDEKVSRAGDTMTGHLVVDGGNIIITNPSPILSFIESDIVAPGGRWRIRADDAIFRFERSTSGDFGSVVDPMILLNTQLQLGSNETSSFGLEIGNTTGGVSTTPHLDFHTSTTSVDYNVRLVASGPTAGLGAGSLTINASGGITVTGNITLPNDPVSNLQAATKQYVDNVATGLDVKGSVRVATTANITLSGTQTIDGIAVVAGNRVLVKNQTITADNGIYDVSAGVWVRSSDADNSPSSGEVLSGMYCFVEEGTVNGSTGWILTTSGTIILGTTGLVFTQFTGVGQITAGTGLTLTGSTLDVNTASATRIVVNADNIDLATVANSGTGIFNKLNIDAYGRVTGTTAVVPGDITTLVNSTYVNVTGDTMTGTLTLSGSFVPLTFIDTDGVAGAGRFRMVSDVNNFYIQRNTAVAGDFSTLHNQFYIRSNGAVVIGSNNFEIGVDTTGNVGVEIGSTTGSSTPFIDFHTSSTSVDYNVRLLASGAAAGQGAGSLAVNATGGVSFDGNIIIDKSTTDAVLTLDANAGKSKYMAFTSSNLHRWILLTSDTPESGSNVGSDFIIRRYDDAGSSLGNLVTMTRSTGAITLAGALTLNADPTAALHAATKQYVDSVAGTGISPGNGLTLTGVILDVNTASTSRIVVNANDIDLATTGIGSGVYNVLTVDAYGRSTAGFLRTLTGPVSGITVSNGTGVSGNPTLTLANDLAGLEGLSTTGIAVRTTTDNWTTRTITGTSGNIVVSNGDGVSGNPVLNLGTVTQGSGSSLVKINIDTFGRVIGNTAISASDITSLVDSSYVNISGDTMTGFLTLNANPTSNLHAATKQYVDALSGTYVNVTGDTMTGTLTLSGSFVPLTFIDTDGVSGAGRFRMVSDINDFFIQRNTAVAGDFSTTQNAIYIRSNGAVAFGVTTLEIGVDSTGNVGVEIGSTTGSSTPFIDFHTSSTSVDYNVRLLASGAAAGVGAGSLAVNATGGVTFNGNITTSGDLIVDGSTANRKLRIDTNAGFERYIEFTSNTAVRWSLGVNNAAESGSNAGSNFFLRRFSDAESPTDVLTIVRSTGAITLVGSLTLNADPTSALQAATKQYVDNSVGSGGKQYQTIVATSNGQTVFNTTISTIALSGTTARLQVFVNGVFQIEGAGEAFTVTGANQITLTVGVNIGDKVSIFVL